MPTHALFSAYVVMCNALLKLPGHRLRIAVLRRLVRDDIGAGCSIERCVRVTTKGGVRIGQATNVNRGCVLDGRGGLEIGSGVNISSETLLLTAEHDPNSREFAGRLRSVVVDDHAWVATRAIVLPGVHIGEGAVIGAGAVVRDDVAPRTIVAGNPAVKVAMRSAQAQQDLPPYRRFMH